MIRQQWTDLAAENKVVQKAELKDDIKQSSTEYWKYLRRCIGKILVSHVTSKVPYPGLTGVNIHTFTLLRGVLRHRQSRPEPRGF